MWWYSWMLAIVGVAGIYFVGRKDKWGWYVLLFNECLWIAYAVTTKQYGFIASAIAYAAVYIKSYIHWSKETINKLHIQIAISEIGGGRDYSVNYVEKFNDIIKV